MTARHATASSCTRTCVRPATFYVAKGESRHLTTEYINLASLSLSFSPSQFSSPFRSTFFSKRGRKRQGAESFHFKDNLQAKPRFIRVIFGLKFISVSSRPSASSLLRSMMHAFISRLTVICEKLHDRAHLTLNISFAILPRAIDPQLLFFSLVLFTIS